LSPQASNLSELIARRGAPNGLIHGPFAADARSEMMSYNPSDHAVEPQRMVAAWALCAGILLVAFGASIISDNDRVRETLLAQPPGGGAVGAVTESSWLPGEHVPTGIGCADNSYS
jgi:hypothetical protein